MYRCNACNADLDEGEQRAHYRSEWHRHNLKRKVAGIPGVSEKLFNLRLELLAAEKNTQEARMIYTCATCNKSYSTVNAHEQHLKSKLHLSRAGDGRDATAVVRPARSPSMDGSKKSLEKEEESEDEWEEVDDGDVDIQSFTDEEDNGTATTAAITDTDWNPAQCFICDAEPDQTLEGCVEHMHRVHGFFIPDAEYLKDATGLLSYLGSKVTKGFMCLYCDESGKQFQSLEAVRKHMIAKSHCKLRYGEGDGGAEEELEDFYDYSRSYEEGGGELMAVDQEDESPISLSTGGYELVLKSSEDGVATKTIGSREFHRYYKQRPRPVEDRSTGGSASAVRALVSRYRSMGLATRQSQRSFVSRKETSHLPAVRLEAMRTKLGLKNNVIRNLPKNCTH
ncbi:hypothetical protein SELMODRAFT_234873 [Selaginella moellendorffii]|uniref:C2H2-type domain-containing protein n=1 Tax=Selaginella moellendorffii TaxID=88036 RepID=D8SQY3_SELML|nr:cytoplasmic 60S subunit biogenesis factor REI1 homolog 1 [Selaginella moellendorffii]EFJ13339.1 hypothetical protein SELMODRAFT_234873 [Selaginella moellendorffii]|eukprot:XP_002985761.1 cytoplasmic 60S subunit biogenesis factor REI1 homolog 1 [Selaginella moellendorffii]